MQDYNDYLKERAQCEDRCPAECEKSIFEVTGQVRNTMDGICKNWNQLPPTDFSSSDYSSVNLENTFDDELSEQEPLEYSESESLVLDLIRSTRYLPLREWGHSIGTCKDCLYDHQNGNASMMSGVYYSSSMSSIAQCNARVSIRISPRPFTTVRHQMAMSFEGIHFKWLGYKF